MTPPSIAETAPFPPVSAPATVATAAVAMTCHLRTVRKGLVLSGGITVRSKTTLGRALSVEANPRIISVLRALPQRGLASGQGADDHQFLRIGDRRIEPP